MWSSPNLGRINNIKPQGHGLSLLTVPQSNSEPNRMASGCTLRKHLPEAQAPMTVKAVRICAYTVTQRWKSLKNGPWNICMEVEERRKKEPKNK